MSNQCPSRPSSKSTSQVPLPLGPSRVTGGRYAEEPFLTVPLSPRINQNARWRRDVASNNFCSSSVRRSLIHWGHQIRVQQDQWLRSQTIFHRCVNTKPFERTLQLSKKVAGRSCGDPSLATLLFLSSESDLHEPRPESLQVPDLELISADRLPWLFAQAYIMSTPADAPTMVPLNGPHYSAGSKQAYMG
ncbi:hypothetical protein BV22DRAFT_793982 [Leucogyrophana mollusca]|uniref:Uncharacterized protein n=1 Tax=Leucogyrophana mollusca TaxID=85980 RepID=A0ACB8B6P5_9AGAM|nr:hypothetical protein BV22DRAFT_793982 [Leucogyrophana mollusca]